MRKIEVSPTIVFTYPRHARAFFEALVADNLDIDRPVQVVLIFARRMRRRHARKRADPETVQDQGRHPRRGRPRGRLLQALRIKQYSKAVKRCASGPSSTTPTTWAASVALPNLEAPDRGPGRQPPVVDTERVGQGCVLASPAFERIAHRFCDPRVHPQAADRDNTHGVRRPLDIGHHLRLDYPKMILTDDQLTAALVTIADRLEVDIQVLPRYSGRAMNGRECLAVVGGPAAGAALLFALAEVAGRDPWDMLAQVGRNGGWWSDDFGLDRLQYWPSIQVRG